MTTHKTTTHPNPIAVAVAGAVAVAVVILANLAVWHGLLPIAGAVLTGGSPVWVAVPIFSVLAGLAVGLLVAGAGAVVGVIEYARPGTFDTDPADIAAAHRRENLDTWADYMSNDYRSGRMGPR